VSAAEVSELPPADPAPPLQAENADEKTPPWLLALLLAAITLCAYWPTFSNGFINYDDPGYVTNNPHIHSGLNAQNIAWAFRATFMANWHPLTWISHMADVQMFGFHPAGHHATSLLLHGINVILLFYLLLAATGFLWRSFVVAALFAIHPLNVECVAWISERKSLLCTLFLFLALFAYGWYVRKPAVGRYVLVALLFALGLLAKPMIVTLPFALLLLDYWPLNRLPVPDSAENTALFFKKLVPLALEKIPLLLLSGASAYITVIAQGRAKAIAANQILPLSVRIPNALWSYLQYLVKAVWPLHLAIFYPHPEDRLGLWKPLLAALFLLGFTWFCVAHGKSRNRLTNVFREGTASAVPKDVEHSGVLTPEVRIAARKPIHEPDSRYLLAGWLWYLGCLVPVIGFVQVGRQAMADRYAYTPLLGIFILVVWWIADNSEALPHRSEILAGAAAVFLIFCGALTWRQTTYWKDNFTLFNHALQTTSANFIAENNLGEAYMQIGQPDVAYEHFLRTTQIKPRFGLGHYNLGITLLGQKRRAEARQEFELAIRYGQDDSEIASAFHNLGIVMLDDNQPVDAIKLFTEALKLVPNKQSSFLARGAAEFQLNNFAAAEGDFVAGANLSPNPAAAYWIGRAREAQGNAQGAVEAYRVTLSMQPDMTEAKQHLDALLSGHIMPFAKQQN